MYNNGYAVMVNTPNGDAFVTKITEKTFSYTFTGNATVYTKEKATAIVTKLKNFKAVLVKIAS